MSAAVTCNGEFKSESDTTDRGYENKERGCARADSEGTRRSPKLGRGNILSPKRGVLLLTAHFWRFEPLANMRATHASRRE
jgi:hypothetical protein